MTHRHVSTNELSIRELREALTRLEELLGGAGELTITRRGRPIARVLPMDPIRKAPSHQRLRESMPHLEMDSEDLVRADREAR